MALSTPSHPCEQLYSNAGGDRWRCRRDAYRRFGDEWLCRPHLQQAKRVKAMFEVVGRITVECSR